MNRLEEVKNELAAALNAWYLEKAEAITPAADFSQAYENGGDVATWAAGLAGQIAEGAADFAGGTAAAVKLTRGLQALAGRPVSGGHYISAEGVKPLDTAYEINSNQRADMLKLLDSIKPVICRDGLADWAPIERAPGTSDLAWAILKLAAQYLTEGARAQGLSFKDVYATAGGIADYQHFTGRTAETVQSAARHKYAEDLKAPADKGAFNVDGD